METIGIKYLMDTSTLYVSRESPGVIRAEYSQNGRLRDVSVHQVHDHDSGNHAAEVILELHYGEGEVHPLRRRALAITLQYMAETR